MKSTFFPRGDWRASFPLIALGLCLAAPVFLRAQAPPPGDLVPLALKLPAPAFLGTPKDIPAGSTAELPSKTPRPPLMVPKDVKNVAPGSAITSSDSNASAEDLAKLTDGDKEATDSSILLMRKGIQWVQFDLKTPQEIYAVVIWHAHDSQKVYHDVIVQVADDGGMTNNVQTLFNNDTGNACKRGAGADREYFESNQGKLIDSKGVKGRYVRLYSNGSTDSSMNEYTEVEIYARPAK